MAVFDNIDPTWLEQEPSTDLYPSNLFSPSCKDVWENAVAETHENSSLGSYKDQWTYCIECFIDLCYRARREPFVESAETVNDTIFDNLKAQYREIISFLIRMPCKVKEKGKEKCFITDNGFYIVLDYSFSSDISNFVDNLLHLGFTQVGVGYQYRAPKGAGLLVSEIRVNPETTRGQIRVTITSEKQPVITDDYIPSQSQLSTFILSVIFDTIKKTSNPLKE